MVFLTAQVPVRPVSSQKAKPGCATMQTCAKDTIHSFLHRQKMKVHSEAAMKADVPFSPMLSHHNECVAV